MKIYKKSLSKKITSLFLSAMMVFLLFCTVVLNVNASYELPTDMQIFSGSAIFISLDAEEKYDMVLYEKNIDVKRSPAALVHIMVALVASDFVTEKSINWDSEIVEYTEAYNNIVSGTHISTANIKIGEQWHLKDLLNLSLMRTSGDATVALAMYLAGDMDVFITKMNEKAVEIGCTDTQFGNIMGLDDAPQFTTARDMAKILRCAMKNARIVTALSAATFAASAVGNETQTTFTSSNGLLNSYDPMLFGKTAASSIEGRSMASVSQKSGYEYICVVLGAPEQNEDGKKNLHFADTRTLVDWAIGNFSYKQVIKKDQPLAQLKVNLAWNKDSVTLVPETPFSTTLKNDLDPETIEFKYTLENDGELDAPIEKDKVYGKVELFIRVDQKIGEINLIASESVEKSEVLVFWGKVKAVISSKWFFIGLGILVVLFIIYVIWNIIHNVKRRKNNQKKIKDYR